MRRLIVILAIGGFYGCTAICKISPLCSPSPVPSPTPTPTPPAQTIVFPELLLRQADGKLTRGSQPFLMFGAIPCWDPLEIDHHGWGGFDQAWIDYTKAKGANIYHMRLGPSLNFDDWPNGLNYQHAPYVPDATHAWDEVWWARARQMVINAGNAGANVEVDLIDGWICKHAGPDWNDFTSPWSAADVEACTNHLTDTHRAFLRKAVETFGPLANVIWQDGNEVGVSGRYDPQWTLGIVAEVRRLEQEVGLGVVHMFGTNSGNTDVECDSRIDYSSTHNRAGISGPNCGKFMQNNEHNPPFTPEQERQLYCAARNAGQAWWYWRGGQSQAEMDETLTLMAQPCGDVGAGDCPFDVPIVAQIKVKPHGTDYYDSTPLVNGGAYCRGVGFTDGRTTCPLRTEGDPFRLACELKSMGGQINWSLREQTGDISIKVKNQGFGFAVEGAGSARVVCEAPVRPGEDICHSGDGGEVRISK